MYKNLDDVVKACSEKSKDVMNHNMNHNMSCYDIKFINNHNMNHDMSYMQVSKQEYARICSILEQWGVFAPKKIIKEHTPLKVKEAISRVEYIQPRNKGAYFMTVVKSIA